MVDIIVVALGGLFTLFCCTPQQIVDSRELKYNKLTSGFNPNSHLFIQQITLSKTFLQLNLSPLERVFS